MSAEYRVQLDIFSGPLDLLLYLVRRDEVDVQDIAIARVAEQYLDYVRVLEQLDPNTAGDFLVLASTLVELKSRALLPTPPLDGADEEDDARVALVRQLLEYKRFKDAARTLGHAADDRARKYERQPAELPPELAGVELEDAEIWDLVEAFGRVMTSIGRGPGIHEVRYDDTPIEEYVVEILALLEYEGPTTFQNLFANRQTRVEVIGLFLALLELIRRRRVRAEQDRNFGIIYLFLLAEVPDAPEPPAPASAVGDERTDPPLDAGNAGVLAQAAKDCDAPLQPLVAEAPAPPLGEPGGPSAAPGVRLPSSEPAHIAPAGPPVEHAYASFGKDDLAGHDDSLDGEPDDDAAQ